MEEISWKIIDKYFKENPYNLIAHHLDSYNNFISTGISKILKENNPIRFIEQNELKKDKDLEEIEVEVLNRNECSLYLGGKEGDKIYYGKPIIYDDDRSHFMYPNDARLRNMNYGVTIHIDVLVEFVYFIEEERKEHTITLDQIYLGKIPIMLYSNLCILNKLPKEVVYNMGECLNDLGGYFIIDGKEKVIVSQEKFANNILYTKKMNKNDIYSYSVEIRSVSEDASKPRRTTSIKIMRPSNTYTNNQILVFIPNVRKPIPFFIVMRALGILSDKQIIETCLLNLQENKSYIDLFIPSIHDANMVFSQIAALQYISSFTKRGTLSSVYDILMNYFLPHLGELNFLNKAYFLGYMVNKLLRVFTGIEKTTDRDSFKYKRVEVSGDLISDLFREYYLIQQKHIKLLIEKTYYFGKINYENENFLLLIENNYKTFFQERIVERGIRKGFKGNWGSDVHTKREGIVQDLNRLSWMTSMSHLRKINLPMDSTSKVVKPRLLNNTQWGYIDPLDSPDGGNIGFHKHLTIMASITSQVSSFPIIEWLKEETDLQLIGQCNNNTLYESTKILVNGNWLGITQEPILLTNKLKLYKRTGLIPIYISVSFQIQENSVYIYTDSGRLVRPIYYIEKGKISYEKAEKDLTWVEIVSGTLEKKDKNYSLKNNLFYDVKELYETEVKIETLIKNQSIIEYIDVVEEESALIAFNETLVENNKYYTHVEVKPSLMLGVLGNCIIYPENNQLPRNVFSCGQSKQAVSLYHTNYTLRMDKMAVVLNYGQIPLIKSRYLEYINHEQQPYGNNATVAIMCYSGYNVEDAILINEGSIKRGLFRTTYYTTYEADEEIENTGEVQIKSLFTEIMVPGKNISRLKPGYDYSLLDDKGLVKENTPIHDKIAIIGKVTTTSDNQNVMSDNSVFTKKGQLGFVDKSFITENEEGKRLAKVRIREDRVPALGDKMASRAGQKGTLGLIIPEENMPFTSNGVRPDLIINPHALPSRMTIGQLTECLFGKVCAMYGGFGDSTAFSIKGPNTKLYGKMLNDVGYHSSGNQMLYNGMTGEMIQSEIFIGPTYYLRLKHMVKDKINYRAKGPNTALTRQPVQGRSNDGGLRIGEMEKDAIIAHGASKFLNDSFMKRSDEYYMAVCNISGCVAVYNPSLNLFLSPFVDGPLVFKEGVDNKSLHLNNVSRFGRNFSILRIPYALKLLIQELLAMNIQMRLITEDNIDQFVSMSYSNNINKLLNKPNEDLDKVIKSFKEDTLKKKKEMDAEKYSTQETKHFEYKQAEQEEYQILKSPIQLLPSYTTGEIDEDYKSPALAPYSPALTAYSPPMAPDEEGESPPMAPYSPAVEGDIGSINYGTPGDEYQAPDYMKGYQTPRFGEESINYGTPPGNDNYAILQDDTLKDVYQAPDYMKGYKVNNVKYLPPVRQQASPDFQDESQEINDTAKGNMTETMEDLLSKEENILDVKETSVDEEDKKEEDNASSRRIITT
jgi:DNA-directed RNA polymerase II subunit RPB2